MSMRPPQTPRGYGVGSGAGSTPGAVSTRRKSALPVRPPSSLNNAQNAAEIGSLREAMRHNDPSKYYSAPNGDDDALRDGSPSHSPTPNGAKQAALSTTQRASKAPDGQPRIGDHVKFTVASTTMQGTVRFIGPVQAKEGVWAGVELDSEWHGKGKNDGSVQGVHYFRCAPLCGLFLPSSKLVVLESASSVQKQQPSASQAALSRITAGSRASKYVGMTAKDLAAQRRPQPVVSVQTPSRSTASPVIRAPSSASSSPSKRPPADRSQLSASTASSSAGTTFATPRGKPRTSMAMPTPSTARKTPRLSMGPSSIRRPSSSLRTNAPDVPPIPAPFARSVTPAGGHRATNIGRGTPSTPSVTAAHRRTSVATSESRPTTPSVTGRSVSRQSFASSISRQSGRSSVLGQSSSYPFVPDDQSKKEELQAALEREKELRMLLEGSEKIGREMEDQLADARDQLRKSVARVASLETHHDDQADELVGDAEDSDKQRLVQVEGELQTLKSTIEEQHAKADRQAQEMATKLAARDSEIEALRDRMQAASASFDEQRQELEAELAKLRTAGQALCATYEERIAEIENDRLAAVERAEEATTKFTEHRASQKDASLSASSTAAMAERDEAARIDAETAQAEIAHLQDKVRQLEDQLDERREKLESEIEESNKRAAKASDAETRLKKEVSTLMVSLEDASKSEARAQARIAEVEEALRESQAQLERERGELEGLRQEATASASAAAIEDLARANKQLTSLRTQNSALTKEAEDARTSAADSASLVEELRASLKLVEADLEKSREQLASLPSRQPSPVATRSADATSEDDVAAMREQIVGLKVLVSTLTDENRDWQEKHRLVSESLDKSKSTETGSGDQPSSLETELASLRTELQQVRDAAAKEKETYNQDIADLEALVESKLYREEELEDELEKYKALVKASSSTQPSNGRAAKSSTDDAHSSAASEDGSQATGIALTTDAADQSQDECEMCGQIGHDLDTCPDFGGSGTSSRAKKAPVSNDKDDGKEYCDDCEEYGHSLDNCPLANEIF